MHYAYRYRLHPTETQREMLDFHRDTCRQLYNHALNEFEQIPDSAGTPTQRVRQVRDQLPNLKDWWNELNDLYSTVTQAAVMRIEDSIKALSQLKQNGYNVGSLNWKAPREFRSFKYVQSGFEFDKKNGQTVLSLSKLADIPISYHREIPEDVTVKEVCIKKERTGDWYASFAVEGKAEPPKPDNPDCCVGIDVGILKYAHCSVVGCPASCSRSGRPAGFGPASVEAESSQRTVCRTADDRPGSRADTCSLSAVPTPWVRGEIRVPR